MILKKLGRQLNPAMVKGNEEHLEQHLDEKHDQHRDEHFEQDDKDGDEDGLALGGKLVSKASLKIVQPPPPAPGWQHGAAFFVSFFIKIKKFKNVDPTTAPAGWQHRTTFF